MGGKNIRKKRFFYRGHSTGLLLPLDHGLTLGPIEGMRSVTQLSRCLSHPAICSVIAHKGILERLSEASLLDGVERIRTKNRVEEASKLWAEARSS